MFSLSGVARYLFVALGEAVMFAVISSCVLSRTLVPTMLMWFERRRHERETGQGTFAAGRIRRGAHAAFWVRPLVALQHGFENAFDHIRAADADLLGKVVQHRAALAVGVLSFC